jgi:hypothetical protein
MNNFPAPSCPPPLPVRCLFLYTALSPLPSGSLQLDPSSSVDPTTWPVYRNRGRGRVFVRVTPLFLCHLSTEESKTDPHNRMESWKTLDSKIHGKQSIPNCLGPVRTFLHHLS